MAPGFTPSKKRYGAKLKSIRKQRGLSQEACADRLGVTRRTWIRWETGETSPEPENRERIADLLEAPELLEDEEESRVPDMYDALAEQLRLIAEDAAAKAFARLERERNSA